MYQALDHFLADPVVRDWLFARDPAKLLRDARDKPHVFFTDAAIFSDTYISPDPATAYKMHNSAVRVAALSIPSHRHGNFVLGHIFVNAPPFYGSLNREGFPQADTLAFIRRKVITVHRGEIICIEMHWTSNTFANALVFRIGPFGRQHVEVYRLEFESDLLPPKVLSLTALDDDGTCAFCWSRAVSCLCPPSFRARANAAIVPVTHSVSAIIEQFIHLRNRSFSLTRFAVFTGPFGRLAGADVLRRPNPDAPPRLELLAADSTARASILPSARGQFYVHTILTMKHDRALDQMRTQLFHLFGTHSPPQIDAALLKDTPQQDLSPETIQTPSDHVETTPSSPQTPSHTSSKSTPALPPIQPSRSPPKHPAHRQRTPAGATPTTAITTSPATATAAAPAGATTTPRDAFTCDACNLAFANKSNMKRHLRVVHAKVRALQCHLCPYSCYQKCDYVRHMQRRHAVHDVCNIRNMRSAFTQNNNAVNTVVDIHAGPHLATARD